ncbi:bifunctional riboflavin kinase/FAD synthetase [Chlorobium phaeobacteroides]|uniref:Riboflavin biosynthesis protein n=1 Tax=Chlorobium phaeobacteroides (strain DSM 266 / SMG 266 / 2430) TaxID=290317 RepID=A1BDF4_CHLPD|nr:bifunctional riboflavin kinase/FAD synthetase [Chlorobium phaeobacteroides]ABL64431.1 FMN adenylyltransferase [Chlorobium phaeobacteroides DSM 266]
MLVVEYQNNDVVAYPSGEPVIFSPVPSAVTIGSFDGVHRGHRSIIARMNAIARSRQLRSVVVTFEPHPRRVLSASASPSPLVLSTLDEKVALLTSLDVDLLFVIRFTDAFAARSSEDFIVGVLVKLLCAKSIIVGYDHGFGRNRTGSSETLLHLGKEFGFDVEAITEVKIGNEHFSSTRIRKLLESGNLSDANQFLGYSYIVSGTVVGGDQRGRTIGFPTVNIKPSDPQKLLPHSGVYLAMIELDGISYKAMMNIGVRPTVSQGNEKTVEAHIPGFSGELYGAFLSFRLLVYIREEKKFATIDELKEQLEKDKKTVELYNE